MSERINSFKELRGYQLAMDAAMEIFLLSKRFPTEEKYSLTDQLRRSSRSVCCNTAEAWRKRRYPPAFIAKLSDAETEAAETQTWIEFCKRCGYFNDETCSRLDDHYDHIMRQLVKMIDDPTKWIIRADAAAKQEITARPRSPIRPVAPSPIQE